MSKTRELKDRIDSVKKTKKLTQAMKMVSASKFKRASDKTNLSRPYYDALDGILRNLSSRMEPDFIPTLMQDNDATTDAVIVITGDRGLCGSFNANVIKAAETFLKDQEADTELYMFGNKGYTYFKRREWSIVEHYSNFAEDLSLMKIEKHLTPIIDRFINGEIRKLWLIHNEFESAISNNQVKVQLLPLELPNTTDQEPAIESDYFYDPDRAGVLNRLISDYVMYCVFKAFLESTAAEEGSRMAAMDAATDNAGQMIEDLTLLFNRSRQAQITTELSEIVAGAEALVQ